MGIVANYARMSEEQLAICIAEPQKFFSGIMELHGVEVVDIDRSWEPLAWLVSPCKRVEQECDSLAIKKIMFEETPAKQTIGSRILGIFKKKSLAEVPESLCRIDEIPLDLPLIAIEGRTENREDKLDLGMGHPVGVASPFFTKQTNKKAVTPHTTGLHGLFFFNR